MPYVKNSEGVWTWVEEGQQAAASTPAQADGRTQVTNAAAAYAQQHQGYNAHSVMQEGTVTYRNGKPGIMIKYDTPQGSSTEWTPLPDDYAGGVGAGDIGGAGSNGGPGGGGGMSGGSYYDQMKSLLQSQGLSERASTKSAIQQALIRFGLVPEGFKDQLGAVDDTTLALIKKNTDTGISGYARLLQEKQDAITNLMTSLGARGMRRSGTKGYKLRRGQLDWDRSFQDALGGLLTDVGNRYGLYAQNEAQRQRDLLSALYQSQNYNGPSSGGPGVTTSSGGPLWAGTWAEGIDTGGYKPYTSSQGLVDLARAGANVWNVGMPAGGGKKGGYY